MEVRINLSMGIDQTKMFSTIPEVIDIQLVGPFERLSDQFSAVVK